MDLQENNGLKSISFNLGQKEIKKEIKFNFSFLKNKKFINILFLLYNSINIDIVYYRS